MKIQVSLNVHYKNLNIFIIESKKSCEFEISLITIDTEHLDIPDTKYSSLITMPSSEFSRICKELYAIKWNSKYWSW